MRSVLSAMLVMLLGCSAPSGTPSPVPTLAPTPTPALAPTPPVIDPRVAEVIAAAKKRLAADKALVSNRSSYERDVQRQLRQRNESRMQARLVPGSMDDHGLEDALRGAATDAGLVLVSLKITSPAAPKLVPSEHRGASAYTYEPAQLFGAYVVKARLGATDPKGVASWLEAMERAKAPLPFVVKVEPIERDMMVEARCLVEFDVKPPWHLVDALTVASLAAAAGVEAPPDAAFGDQLAVVNALIAEHTLLLPEIDKTLKALGQSHLEAERFRIYARAADGIDDALGTGHEH